MSTLCLLLLDWSRHQSAYPIFVGQAMPSLRSKRIRSSLDTPYRRSNKILGRSMGRRGTGGQGTNHTVITNNQQYQQRKCYGKAQEILDLDRSMHSPQQVLPFEEFPGSNKTRCNTAYANLNARYLRHNVRQHLSRLTKMPTDVTFHQGHQPNTHLQYDQHLPRPGERACSI